MFLDKTVKRVYSHFRSLFALSQLIMVALCNRADHYIFMLWFVLLLLLLMVALCNRADHYIFMLWFVLLSSFFLLFFPSLILAVGDWMFTILWHMVWP